MNCNLFYAIIPIKESDFMAKKVVLVTGASRGIGKAIAVKFAKKGYNVVISCAHREAELMQAKKEIEGYQVSCLAFLGDMGDISTCETMFQQIKKQFGTLDVLVNNAGISYIGLLQDMTSDDWDRIVRTNLTSVFNCCKLAIPMMLSAEKGKIINISSVWGNVGASCEVAYSATKGGINAFTKALAKELAPSNIQVNAVACGVIDTAMNQRLTIEERKDLEEEIPMGRFGTTDEVASIIWDIANASPYMTGQVIGIDGGYL